MKLLVFLIIFYAFVLINRKSYVIQVCKIRYYQGDLAKGDKSPSLGSKTRLERIKYVDIYYIDEEKAMKTFAEFSILDKDLISVYRQHRMSLYDGIKLASKYYKGNYKGDLQQVIDLNFPRYWNLIMIKDEDIRDQSRLIKEYFGSNKSLFDETRSAWMNSMVSIDTYRFGYVDNERKMLSWDDVVKYVQDGKEEIEYRTVFGASYKVSETFYVVDGFL